jgi:serine phosphatase RsbU (regulator of sigma subunit)
VPGGFMSVLGMTNLNYIVGQEIMPDAILNKLREAIMWDLRQSDGDITAFELNARVLDGMDAAVYVVNEKQMTLSFAGANNPLILVRGEEVRVIKPDSMPVGVTIKMVPFKSVTIELQKGDCLYTYSDGFQDQFSVEAEKKFQKKHLRDLLLEIHDRPMSEQKNLLSCIFNEWRGPAENQTDDVVIMGVRI